MRRLLELTAALVVQLLLLGHSRSTVRLPELLTCSVLAAQASALPGHGRVLLRCAVALIGRALGWGALDSSHVSTSIFVVLGLLSNDIEDTVLQGFLIFAETVLLPSVVLDFDVEVMSGHARLEEADHGFVVGLRFELERTAVVHVFFELRGVAAAQLVQGSVNLLLFNVVILLILRTPGQSLPR